MRKVGNSVTAHPAFYVSLHGVGVGAGSWCFTAPMTRTTITDGDIYRGQLGIVQRGVIGKG